ncbi:DUF4113 domain-containing protein [Luteimonas sp. MJ250]|uniref:DUF4113 domain-containing protein n=1 Tax=Luteimonas sp. MJ250 TaxID=3129236 RepID=UPI0031BBA570
MAVLDKASAKFGRGTMGFASAHRARPAQSRLRQEHLSPSYTTRWDPFAQGALVGVSTGYGVGGSN